MKMHITSPYLYLRVFPFGGSGKRSPNVASIVEEALEMRFPSWYEVPTTKVRKEPGESSMRWMGMTPQAP